MLEKTIEAKITKRAKELQFLTYKFVSVAHRGMPDRLFITPIGEIFFIEFKSIKGRISALQRHEINNLESYNINVHIVRDVEYGLAILDFYSKRCKSTNYV